MIYGFSGPSGSGKTTLCKMVSEAMDIPFIATSISEVAKRHGFDAVADLSLPDRLQLQKLLLVDHMAVLEKAPAPVIVDRTPIDMVGYLMCEFNMNSHKAMSMEQLESVTDLVGSYIGTTRRYYDHIFHLCPLPHYETAETRPALNPAFHLHSDLVMRGALELSSVSHSIIGIADLDVRFTYVTDTLEKRLNQIDKLRNKARHVH